MRGWDFYASRADKAYSLVDCISMNTMRAMQLGLAPRVAAAAGSPCQRLVDLAATTSLLPYACRSVAGAKVLRLDHRHVQPPVELQPDRPANALVRTCSFLL